MLGRLDPRSGLLLHGPRPTKTGKRIEVLPSADNILWNVSTAVQAIETLFNQHSRMLQAYIHSMVGDWAAAADLTQETFVIAHRKIASIDPGRPTAPWLRGIARNLARNHLRKRARDRLFLADAAEIERTFAVAERGEEADAWGAELPALARCIEELPPNQRDAIAMFYRQRKRAAGIAADLGVQEKTVFQLLWQARRNLRQCIAKRMATGGADHV